MAKILLLAVLSAVGAGATDKLPAYGDGIDLNRQNTLIEMRSRGIIAAEAEDWTPEDLRALRLARRAEAEGAIGFLRKRGSLAGLAAAHKPAGSSSKRLRLTKEGAQRYFVLKAQDARSYFESKGVPAKDAFLLRDVRESRLFGDDGLLTDAGEALYRDIQAGRKADWILPSGERRGNRRPPSQP